MNKRKIFIITFVLAVLSLSHTQYTYADIAVFRKDTDNCRTTSLTENLSVSKSGGTGRGCTFNVDVRATGDWVAVGAYFDSPPYAWGADHFWDIDEKKGDPDGNSRILPYSFTCSLPTYNLDASWLPSYVTMTGSQTIAGSGTDVAPGKRYTFLVKSTAPTGSSFDIPLSFSANCNMYVIKNVKTLTESVEEGTGSCKNQPLVNINPRTANVDYTVTIGTSCVGPTATPGPSSTPTPKPTKTPTPTPPAGSTPTPTGGPPTPTDTPDPTDTPGPSPTPYHLACSGITCSSIDGPGTNSCSPEDAICKQTVSGCPKTCGSYPAASQTCSCSGPCCPGTCSNGLKCGTSAVVACCNSEKPTAPTNVKATEPDGDTTIQTRTIKVAWNFGGNSVGCGNPFGFNCKGDAPKFYLQVDNDDDFSSPIIDLPNIPSTARTYTTTAADGLLTTNTRYYVQVCAVNYLSSCTQTSFVKTAYPPGQVSGSVGEYDNNSATTFTNTGASGNTVSFTIVSTTPGGITSTCSVTTGGTPPSTRTYTCSISIDNVNNDPVPTQTLTLSSSGYNNSLYTGICFQNGSNCTTPTTINVDFDVNGGSTTNINKPVYFTINPALSYFKLKNASLQTHNSSVNKPLFPASTLLFDNSGDDYNTSGNYVIIGDNPASHTGAGLVLLNTATSLGGGLASEKSVPPYPPGKNWTNEGYAPITTFNSQRFLEYVRTRKEYQTINNLSQISSSKINVWNSNSLTITSDNDFDTKNAVLIVDGTVTLALNTFNPSTASTAIIADTINFSGGGQNVQEAHGIFIANTVNLGTTNQPLKIFGNISSTQNSVSLSRVRDDNRKPSLFIVFQIDPYIELLSQLSTALYEWKQLQ